MRELGIATVTEHVARLFVEANTLLGDDVVSTFRSCLASETSPTGRDILDQLLENADLARASGVPLCQDTGYTVVYLDVGQDVGGYGVLEACASGAPVQTLDLVGKDEEGVIGCATFGAVTVKIGNMPVNGADPVDAWLDLYGTHANLQNE